MLKLRNKNRKLAVNLRTFCNKRNTYAN